jgi:phage-related protein
MTEQTWRVIFQQQAGGGTAGGGGGGEGGEGGGGAEQTQQAARVINDNSNMFASVGSFFSKISGMGGEFGTLISLLKESVIVETFFKNFFKILSTMVDILLMPLVPLIFPILRYLIGFIPFVWELSKKIEEFIKDPWQGIKNIFNTLGSVMESLLSGIGGAGGFWGKIGKEINTMLGDIGGIIANKGKQIWDTMFDTSLPFFDRLRKAAGLFFEMVSGIWGELMEHGPKIAKEFIGWLKAEGLPALKDLFEKWKPVFKEFWDTVRPIFQDVWKTYVDPVINDIKKTAEKMWKTYVDPIINDIRRAWDVFFGIGEKLWNWFVGQWLPWLWNTQIVPTLKSATDEVIKSAKSLVAEALGALAIIVSTIGPTAWGPAITLGVMSHNLRQEANVPPIQGAPIQATPPPPMPNVGKDLEKVVNILSGKLPEGANNIGASYKELGNFLATIESMGNKVPPVKENFDKFIIAVEESGNKFPLVKGEVVELTNVFAELEKQTPDVATEIVKVKDESFFAAEGMRTFGSTIHDVGKSLRNMAADLQEDSRRLRMAINKTEGVVQDAINNMPS